MYHGMQLNQGILKDKRVRSIVALLLMLILAASAYLLVNWRMDRNVNLADVFQESKVVTNQSSLEMAAKYETRALTKEQKQKLLGDIADQIGLEIGPSDYVWESNSKSEQLSVHRKSKAADTRISLVSVNVNEDGEIPVIQNYIMVHLDVFDKMASILEYKKMLHEGFKSLKMSDESAYVQFVGKYPGVLTLDSKNQITDNMIRGLRGHITYENRADDLYTVYAYSGGINDYISVGESKVNIQVAMSYDEGKNETVVYLATPILNGSY